MDVFLNIWFAKNFSISKTIDKAWGKWEPWQWGRIDKSLIAIFAIHWLMLCVNVLAKFCVVWKVFVTKSARQISIFIKMPFSMILKKWLTHKYLIAIIAHKLVIFQVIQNLSHGFVLIFFVVSYGLPFLGCWWF